MLKQTLEGQLALGTVSTSNINTALLLRLLDGMRVEKESIKIVCLVPCTSISKTSGSIFPTYTSTGKLQAALNYYNLFINKQSKTKTKKKSMYTIKQAL